MFLNESEEDKSSEALILSNEGLPHIETHLQLAHAEMINECQEKLNDEPEHACVSCYRLLAKAQSPSLSIHQKNLSMKHGNA